MPKFKHLLLAGALIVPLPAFAQASLDAEGEEIVVSASGAPQAVEETGRAVTRIDREEIATRQTVLLADLLATTPGVAVTRNGGIGGFTGLRIRGAEAEQTLVLVDGVRTNDPSSPGGGFDFANLLAGSVERVEVLRGPNAVAYGSQAIGGVVNIVTLRPEDGFTPTARVEYGDDDTLYASAGAQVGAGPVSGALTGGYLRTDGISAAANGSERDGYEQKGATGRLGVELGSGFGLDVRASYSDSRTDIDGFPPPTYAFADTAEYSTSEEFYGYVGAHADLGGIRHRVYFTLADINRDNFDPSAGSDPIFFGRGRTERYAYQGDARAIDALRLVFGAEHEDSRFDDGSTAQTTGITSGYLEAEAKPLDMLTLTGGVRHDDHRDFGAHTSLGANAALEPVKGTVLRASYGDGFKAPTLYQLYSFYGTPTLRPETAQSWEVGIDQSILGLRAGATWFHRDTKNQIDFDLLTFTYANIARTRAEGVELELAGSPVKGLTLRGAYSHVDAGNRSPGANFGNDLARRPQDTASLSADYRLPVIGLSLGGTVFVAGDSFDNAANSVRLDGYTLVGVRAEMPVSDAIALYARVENLFDEDYRTVAGYGTPGRAANVGLRLRLK